MNRLAEEKLSKYGWHHYLDMLSDGETEEADWKITESEEGERTPYWLHSRVL